MEKVPEIERHCMRCNEPLSDYCPKCEAAILSEAIAKIVQEKRKNAKPIHATMLEVKQRPPLVI